MLVPLPGFADFDLRNSTAVVAGEFSGRSNKRADRDDARGERFECTLDHGRCGIVDLRWPSEDEPNQPVW